MQNGFRIWQCEPDGSGEIVTLNLRFSLFNRPGNIVQIGADGLAGTIEAKKAVSLGNKVLERPTAVLGQPAARPQPPVARIEYNFAV